MGSLRVSDLLFIDGIDEKDLILYQYPDSDLLDKAKIKGIFLGYYFNWDGKENKEIAEKKQTLNRGIQTWKALIIVLKI